ncbi:MAG: glycosyltransferase family 4 protein [Chloroflexi bacterium]|nr:glycosyltransferase family 4 protein [Chloroflexota bacterium]
MNIAIVSTRLSGLDGVSLEATKVANVFAEMGHNIFWCAGELDESKTPGRLIPEMHFMHPTARAIHDEAFSGPYASPELIERIYDEADKLRLELLDFVREFDIDLLVSQNSNAIPMNIQLGVALTHLAKRHGVKLLCHNHDFYFERDRFIANGIQFILDEAFPPVLSNVRHMVINVAMQRRIKSFKGIDALYLPNVFDYDNAPPPPDDYAMTFRETVGLSDNDIIALQATRLIRRKGIEKAIELIHKLDDERVVLVFTRTGKKDEGEGYGEWLRDMADRYQIRYLFIGDYLDETRGERDGHKVFSLWDVYPHAHFITYPSIYEGFGNALLETLYFRKPLVVNQYPMYLTDIKPTGIQAVEFNYDITDDTVAQTRRLIEDDGWVAAMVEHNYQVASRHFSYSVLKSKLRKALESFTDD